VTLQHKRFWDLPRLLPHELLEAMPDWPQHHHFTTHLTCQGKLMLEFIPPAATRINTPNIAISGGGPQANKPHSHIEQCTASRVCLLASCTLFLITAHLPTTPALDICHVLSPMRTRRRLRQVRRLGRAWLQLGPVLQEVGCQFQSRQAQRCLGLLWGSVFCFQYQRLG